MWPAQEKDPNVAISVKYSVKAKDIEEARTWIEEATGLKAEGRESVFWGGNYYAFSAGAGEEVKLFKNVDIHDGGPIVGASFDWRIALLFNGPEAASSVVLSLEKHAEQFEKMSEMDY